MEIELKYRLPTPEVADDIWNDKLFFSYEEDGYREELCLSLIHIFQYPLLDVIFHSIDSSPPLDLLTFQSKQYMSEFKKYTCFGFSV